MDILDAYNEDLRELWPSDSFGVSIADEMDLNADDWTDILDHNPIVLNDRMMTDAVQPPHIQHEHSYSINMNDDDEIVGMKLDEFGISIKLEDKDIESDCFTGISMTSSSSTSDFSDEVMIKQEPASPPPTSSRISTISSLLNAPAQSLSSLHPHSLLKQPTIVLATRPSTTLGSQMLIPKVSIKSEPQNGFSLPPTPPSCNGSDSEGSLSPVHATSSLLAHQSAVTNLLRSSSIPSTSTGHSGSGRRAAKLLLPVNSKNNSQTALISSQPKGATGVLHLTDEEKRTLLAEGYHIPQKLPLTKAEERSLKKIRRKIKNKISAQESRRKKKEYMDSLEKRVELLTTETLELRKTRETVEAHNKTLQAQLQQLQTLLRMKQEPKDKIKRRGVSTQTDSILSLDNDDINFEIYAEDPMDSR